MNIFKHIEFHYDGVYKNYNDELINYFNQLKIAITDKDLEKTIYAVNIIYNWYELNFTTISSSRNNPFDLLSDTLISSYEKIKKFKEIADDINKSGEDSQFFPKEVAMGVQQNLHAPPLIFLSHCSRDRTYGDAIQAFLTGLGVKDRQLVYTTHPRHKIPLGQDIFNYLFDNIHQNVFMILLWSNDYLESTPCLCELGALLVTKGDYVNIFTPEFEMDNPKYQSSPINKNNLGIRIGNNHFRVNMIELKDKIEDFLSLEKNPESTVASLIDDFTDAIVS